MDRGAWGGSYMQGQEHWTGHRRLETLLAFWGGVTIRGLGSVVPG